jgi:caffeoyl-CoA O-methyltransferase
MNAADVRAGAVVGAPEKSLPGGAALTAYARAVSSQPDRVDAALAEATARLGGPAMMLSTPDQARLLSMLVSLLQARAVVELGTFTGRSALAMARALPAGGRLTTCDLSPRWTAIAQEHWRRAEVADRIDLRLQPAMELLRSLPRQECLDLVFVDADKGNYVYYYEEIVPRLRPGGLVVADNVLAGGGVLGEFEPDSVACAMDRYNRRVAADGRVDVVVLTVADGLSLARKRDGHGS